MKKSRVKLAYLIGVALGDGNLSNPNGRAVRLRISCAIDYPHVADEIEQAMRYLLPQNKVSRVRKGTSRCFDLSVYSNKLDEWMPWKTGCGSKITQNAHVPTWVQVDEEYCKACLRGLFQTDGCIYIDRGYQMIHFTNAIRDLARDAYHILSLLGFHPAISRVRNEGRGKYIVRLAHKEEVPKALHLLGLYKA